MALDYPEAEIIQIDGENKICENTQMGYITQQF